jgi:putative ABC transport system permease protein
LDDVAVVGGVTQLTAQAQQQTPPEAASQRWFRVELKGVNDGYLQQAAQVYSFSRRAAGFDTDQAVWEALRTRDDVAVVTADQFRRLPNQTGETPPDQEEFSFDDEEFDGPPGKENQWLPRLRLAGASPTGDLPEITVALRSDADGAVHTVQVIGVIEQSTTLAGDGYLVRKELVDAVAGEPVAPTNFYLKVQPDADVHAVAQATERGFLNNAVNAVVLAESFAQAQALTRGILQVFQGFLALGLLVGIAALGVISTRTVVERRQQVGMLRAIGFQPGMVALSFLLESSFIALTGIIVGTAAGVLLGQGLVQSSIAEIGEGRVFVIPWLQIGWIVLAAYGFSLLTTVLPALQASRIYPAEALRYE